MRDVAIAGQDRINAQRLRRELAQDLHHLATCNERLRDEIGLACDAQALRRRLGQRHAVVGGDAATDWEVRQLPLHLVVPRGGRHVDRISQAFMVLQFTGVRDLAVLQHVVG